jgi:hypothetical protein
MSQESKQADTAGDDSSNKKDGAKAPKARSGEAAMNNISGPLVDQLLKANPSLAGEMQGMDPKKVEEVMKHMNLQDIMTGMVGPSLSLGGFLG